jgi:ABC-type multidrug transport system fused ATPase/permease subunit
MKRYMIKSLPLLHRSALLLLSMPAICAISVCFSSVRLIVSPIHYLHLGLGMFICTFIYMYTWVYTGEVNAKRVRERYLTAVLRQDIQYFDKVGAGEVATRIQTDTRASLSLEIFSAP